MKEIQQVTLYYSDGRSDKVYQAAINEIDCGGAYTVDFAYGRRGSALKAGTKTAAPVDLASAEKIYDKIIAEKVGKGYSPGADSAPFQNTVNAERFSGIQPQLLNPIEADVRDTLLRDPTWCLQEKFDGERRLVVKSNANAEGLNRKGLYIPLLAPIAATVNRLPCTSCVLDGEQVGETLHVFDILELDGERLSERSYGERLHALNQLLAGVDPDAGAVTPVKTAFLPADKRQLMTEVERRDGEGVVLKMLGGVYQAGRPSSGGDQLKFKFYATASCVVRSHTPGKRSVAVGAFDGNNVVDLGNVTIPPNHAIPAPGDVVEVRYLYAYPGGSLYQPIYLGKRSDIDPSECALDQLKYKAPPPAPRRASGMGL